MGESVVWVVMVGLVWMQSVTGLCQAVRYIGEGQCHSLGMG